DLPADRVPGLLGCFAGAKSGQRLRDEPALPATPLGRALRGALLRYIALDGDEARGRRAVGADRRDRGFGDKVAAVAAAIGEITAPAGRASPGLFERATERTTCGIVGGVPADHLGRGESCHSFEGRVDVRHPIVAIRDDHGVIGVVDREAQSSKLELVLLVRGDVLDDAQKALCGTAVTAD